MTVAMGMGPEAGIHPTAALASPRSEVSIRSNASAIRPTSSRWSASLASCVDAKTGKPYWQERIGKAYSASPILVGDLVYFQSEDGLTTIVKADRTFTKVAENQLKGRTFASPAPVDGALFLRTDAALLRIEPEAK